MAKQKKQLFSDSTKRVLALILGGVCSTLILTFSVLTIAAISKSDIALSSRYLLGVFLSMGLASIIVFIKDRNKYNFIRTLILVVFNVILGIIVLFAENNLYLFSLTAGSYCLVIVVSRIIRIIEKKSLRALVFNAILITLVVLLGIGLFIPVDVDGIDNVVLIECLFVAFTALAEVASVAFSQLKFKVLFKIIINTFALEVLFGLLATMVASALVLITVENATFTNFGEALWYTFTVVTTIGFGDIVATTLVGRLVSVILGIYGIIAVAVITSIIVNFYNETSGKKDAKELKNIQKDEEKDKH